MLRLLLLSLACGFAALGLLNLFRSPPWSPWQLGVLAGEYGHWLAPAALGLAGVSWGVVGVSSASGGSTLTLSLLAAGLLLRPGFEAWRLSGPLTRELQPAAGRDEAFSVARLFAGTPPAPVPVTTVQVAPGLPLDLYRPRLASGAARPPCVVVIHGGGWESGDRTQLAPFNHWLAGLGYAVAAVSYRLAPAHRWPAQREDVELALRHLRLHGAELGIDATRLVLLGRSAGGQIAQVVGYAAPDPAIRGVIALYAPSDLIFGYVNTHEDDMLRSPALMRRFLGGTPDSARAAYESASGLFQVGRGAPPTLLLHGRNDALVWHRHSERLSARLDELGVRRVLVELPWATHAFDFNLHGPGGQLTTYAVECFLAEVLQRDGAQAAARKT